MGKYVVIHHRIEHKDAGREGGHRNICYCFEWRPPEDKGGCFLKNVISLSNEVYSHSNGLPIDYEPFS